MEFVNKVDTDIKNGDPNFHYGLKRFLLAYQKARNTNIQDASLFLQNNEITRKYYKNWQVRNNKQIKVQVTSIQRRKTNNNGSKRLNQGKKSKRSFENIENIDPQTIPPRKKRTIKKKHALAESIKQNTKNGNQ
ncbi:hypothetical protein C1646_723867 [Rhizophagus diaphanus]|nr:hypothetical protein C1646_723867 [Rhizophagus diaphanus] [Rhizophagus sp. MUCL 43196]